MRPRASTRDAGRLEPEVFGIGDAAGRDQHRIGADVLLRRKRDVERVAAAGRRRPPYSRTSRSTPHSRKSSSMRAEISPSIIVAKRSPRSTIVTLAPSARQIVANSMPTAPPPTMTIAFGAPRSRYRIVSVSKTPGNSNALPVRPLRARSGRDQDDLRRSVAGARTVARNARHAPSPSRRRLSLDVVDVAGEDVLFRQLLKHASRRPRFACG